MVEDEEKPDELERTVILVYRLCGVWRCLLLPSHPFTYVR